MMHQCGGGMARRFLLQGSSLLALSGIASPAFAAGMARVGLPARAAPIAPIQNLGPLAPQPFLPLPTGSIRPAGWLRRQLEIQARGLGGRLDETWDDVGPNSGWLGGTGEKWERGPYFLDGLLPLAWALDDPILKAKAQRFIDWTLSSVQPDGMFGPATNDDWWPRMVMLKVLLQYEELTGDARVIPLMRDYFHHQLTALPTRPLRDWGRFRWQDELVAVLWLYNRTGDESLIKLAHMLHDQGWDWRQDFAAFPFRAKVTPASIHLNEKASGDLNGSIKDLALAAHGVNNAMGIKAMPLWSLVSHDPADRDGVFGQLATLDQYHGLPIGIFSADEHFAGRSPSQGVELCAVVETLYSLEQALAVTGDTRIADRIERIGYNALPAAFTDDMWSHQYDQQPNQIESSLKPGPWTTNGPESNLFGLEPHFGCCTANFHQGWPKLLGSLWMGSRDGGLAAMLYAPSDLRTIAGGVPVTISTATDYPFRDTVSIRVAPERAAAFPIKLRKPGWADGMTVRVNGTAHNQAAQDGFVTIQRAWKAGDTIEIAFAFTPRFMPAPNQAVSVARGPLLYALPIQARWEKWRQRGLSADWQAFPESPWNYALLEKTAFSYSTHAVPPVPFSAKAPAGSIVVTGIRAADWQAASNYADPPPAGPLALAGARRPLTLIPYGAAKLRITEFPTTRS